MNFSKKAGVALVAVVALLLGLVSPASATASGKFWLCDVSLPQVTGQYGLSSAQLRGVVVDSAMTREEALGDAVVLPEGVAIHAKMKPLLCVLPVVYRGYDSKIHLGQMVVHEYIAPKVMKLFVQMFMLGFPIKSVIPQSHFGYNDDASMAANNSSSYRPEEGSVHAAGAAIDINPVQNPEDHTKYVPNPQPTRPAGAVYDPSAKGAIVKDQPVRMAWTAQQFEWGGGWGDPAATPPTDYFREGYFDYQHFQPDYTWYESFYRDHVPAGV